MLNAKRIRHYIAGILVLIGVVLAGGCATPHDSDIPWNSPASWEGSPYIPGFSQ